MQLNSPVKLSVIKVFLNLWTTLIITFNDVNHYLYKAGEVVGSTAQENFCSLSLYRMEQAKCNHVIISYANNCRLDPRSKHFQCFLQQINIWSPNWLKLVEKTSRFDYLLFSPKSPVNFCSLPSQNPQLKQQLPQAEVCTLFNGNSLLVALNSVFPMAKGSREDCSTGGQRPKAFN